MSEISTSDENRRKRRITAGIKEALRSLRNQLSLLNHQVSGRLELRDVDLDCLDLVTRHGPLSPSALARLAGLHPATMTGVLDRLQRGGWIVRERDPDGTDRRAVTIRALRERGAEIFRLYAGMHGLLDEICAGYSESELDVISDFLHRAADAGRRASEELAED